MKKYLLILSTTFAFGVAANASEIVNCLGEVEDGYQVGICQNVVDTLKLKTIDCTGELEDGYQLSLCSRAKNPNRPENTIDCTGELEDGYQLSLCSTVPDPNSVVRIDCLGDLEDGYQSAVCGEVNMDVQSILNNRL